MRGALHLDQREELMNLHCCMILFGVTKQVGHNGLVIFYVGTQRYGDRFTLAMSDTRSTGTMSLARQRLCSGTRQIT